MAWEKLFDATVGVDSYVLLSSVFSGDNLSLSYNADGSSPFELGMGASLFVESTSSLYIEFGNQAFISLTIISGGDNPSSVSGLVLSNAAFAGLTDINIEDQYLLTSITWPQFTGTLAEAVLTGNALTAAAQDAIILKVWDNAISKASTGKTFNILDNDGTYSAQSAAYLTALDIYRDWNINTGNGALLGVTNVSNVADLQLVAFNLAGTIVLTNNIDASATSGWNGGAGFVPIGVEASGQAFAGIFNGNGHIISNLTINRPTTSNVGLFGVLRTTPGLIKNLGLINGTFVGLDKIGALCGYMFSSTASGRVTITGCYSSGCTVETKTNSTSGRAGGLIGDAYRGVSIENCWSNSTIIGGASSYKGALVGRLTANGNEIVETLNLTNCHSYNSQFNLYGDVTVTGSNRLAITSCYQLKAISPTGVTALTSAEFKDASKFVGWDFSTIWRMGLLYPVLRKFMKKQNANRSIKYLYFGA